MAAVVAVVLAVVVCNNNSQLFKKVFLFKNRPLAQNRLN